jgi:D-alanyl-D-alanine carboxypeptidase/D-alanyl-D-alanine-endopeptidase (penicillin-binding protein 4)
VVTNGILAGDLVVTGDGDPSIAAQDLRAAPLFGEWAEALRSAGIRRIDGRILGDDGAFDDQTLGAGWAWDYLAAGYAAPSSALSYNENVAVLRIRSATSEGAPAAIETGPPGHGLELVNEVTTTSAGTPTSIVLSRLPGSARLTVRGTIPIGSGAVIRTTAVDNPTAYFVEALRLALIESGILVSGVAADADTLPAMALAGSRRAIAEHRSAPLSALIGYAMKVSQNFYGDMLLKAVGRSAGGSVGGAGANSGVGAGSVVGSVEAGRQVVRETLTAWGLPVDSLVMYDGSGLSRYNYVSADLLVGVLKRAWTDERLRGPFVASLPVGGHDGTLEARMRAGTLDRRIQAKTGTIANVRSLAGYALTASGDRLVFAIVGNHFTAPNAQIDAITERLLEELVR